MGIVGILIANLNGPWSKWDYPNVSMAIWAMAAWVYLAAYIALIYRIRMRREFRDRTLLSESREELADAEAEVSGGATDFSTLWHATQKRLDYYHDIATTQSERSFNYGQLAAGSGLLVLLIAAVVAGFSHSTTTSIVAGATGVIGGGIGAYIGATFMRAQEQSAMQLKAYFLQPLEFSKYLAAERLLSGLEGDERDKAIHLIIEGIVLNRSGTPVGQVETPDAS
jgi:protein-S-isoprenylcysteine O-methyltransferase Ste14